MQDTLIASVVGLLCVSCVMFGLRQLDPSRIIASDAKKKKKELGKRLGRPIKLNAYEVIEQFLCRAEPTSLNCHKPNSQEYKKYASKLT